MKLGGSGGGQEQLLGPQAPGRMNQERKKSGIKGAKHKDFLEASKRGVGEIVGELT